ncbi:hypothetical protein NDU88_004207 [Pleurodeles waltl]|uniref:Uncharacterized protein n=1 Tax=Pleurodeles waltl TaxID=8319 RepID=A0AAV7SI54_PLEWA|nr:hypothetical protein NDU88_004207 [Pleurodeles waltl]
MPSGPSKEATGADASNPERNSVTSYPFGFPGIIRQRQKVCVTGIEDEEETPAGGVERAEETGGTGAEDERRLQRPVTIDEPSGRGSAWKVPTRESQFRQWCGKLSTKFPATLQEKRGQTRCVPIKV